MRFTKILLVCLGLVWIGGFRGNQSLAAARPVSPVLNAVFADGGEPLPRPPLLADGGEPLPKPPLFADGGEPLPKPPLFADGGAPLPPPLVADGGEPLPKPPLANSLAS